MRSHRRCTCICLCMPSVATASCALLAMDGNLSSSHRCDVPDDSCGHTLDSFVRRLPPARCRQCLEMLRSVTGAKSQVLHLSLPMTVRLHCCFNEVSQCLQVSSGFVKLSYATQGELICSVNLCHVLELPFTRTLQQRSTLLCASMVAAVRADKQARAALHHFSKWHFITLDHRTQCAVSAASVAACMMQGA